MSSSNSHEIKFEGLKFTTVVANSSALVDSFFNKLRRSLCVENINIRKPVIGLEVCYINPNLADEKVATLQLCYGTCCIVIQLLHLDSIPQSLKTFLADPDICYACVNINNAVAKLQRDFGLECVSTRNLRPFDDSFFEQELFGRGYDLEMVNKVTEELLLIRFEMNKITGICCDWTVPFFRDELLAPVLHFFSVDRGERGGSAGRGGGFPWIRSRLLVCHPMCTS